MQVVYLGHSGFAVRLPGKTLIFDYYLDQPRGGGLSHGVVDPAELREDEVTVFVSHRHADHYNPHIFSWHKELARIQYIVSDDVKTQEEVCRVHGGQRLQVNGLDIRTLDSTDEGVAFLVDVDGKTIYHAGDLNWWHWDGEPESDNARMKARYFEQIGFLRGARIDLAFVPVDPRLKDAYLFGLDALMRTADIRRVIPMHFWEDYSIFSRLTADSRTAPYRSRIVTLTGRGMQMEFDD